MISNPAYQRPVEGGRLAAFDQASQRPSFPAGDSCRSPEEFLEWAYARDHPSAVPPAPLPADLEAAITHVWSCGTSAGWDRERRFSVIRSVAADLEPLSSQIEGMMSDAAVTVARAVRLNLLRRSQPDATLDDVGDEIHCVHFGMWCAILDSLRWPHRRLVRDMVLGFRTVGDIPDSGIWRQVDRPAEEGFASFAATNVAWFYECRHRVLRAAERNPEMAAACYQRTLEERDSGLITGPFSATQLNAPRSSGFPAFGFGRYRPLPRFAIWQGNKYRCIDDGAASGTNGRGTSTAETIVCDRPDVPLRVGQRFHELGPPPGSPWVVVRMGGGADDAWAAYRRVVTADEEYTVVMVAVPPAEGSGSEWTVQLFRIPGHPFGLVSAVLNWNCIPEPIVAFARRALAVPVSRFYDDHCISEPEYAAFSSGLSAQASYFSLHELIRFHFDLGKHKPWSRCVVYCGVQTDWQDDVNSVVSIGVTRERRDKLRTRIAAVIDANSLSPAEASSLRGKARWCVSPVFGRVGLAAVALLKQRQQSSSSELDDELRDALEFLGVVVDVLPQFVVRFRRGEPRPPVVVLTDASFETGHTWLGFLICCPIAGCVWAGEETPEWLLALLARHKRRESYIGQLETAIASGPYFTCPSMFRDRAVFHYVDNQGALYSLINGRSRDGDTNRLVFLTLLRAVQLRCDVWFDYVPSASNIADLPTRLDAAAFARLERIGTRVRPVRLPPEWCLECPNAQLAQLFDGEW